MKLIQNVCVIRLSTQVQRRPKSAMEKLPCRSNDPQPTSTSAAGDHQQKQQQASSIIRYTPVPAPRRRKANVNLSQPTEVEQDNERTRQDVGQVVSHTQNEVKGQGRHENQWDISESFSDRDNIDTEELTDNDVDDVVEETADGSSLTSSSKSEDTVIKSASYPVRWIGSAPFSNQLRGKQRSDAIVALASKLSSAVESLGRVSSPCFANCMLVNK